ncbi:hypothetical protein EAG_01055 [Camponotus floridanus]|uniref:Uncharacterized protein n=1 Tax=Camponotus floridanus TaxID=104421 RepID=E2AB39_CAMFO|nr:hypothetical protein EAG_01055 [Camponotus floridanus]
MMLLRTFWWLVCTSSVTLGAQRGKELGSDGKGTAVAIDIPLRRSENSVVEWARSPFPPPLPIVPVSTAMLHTLAARDAWRDCILDPRDEITPMAYDGIEAFLHIKIVDKHIGSLHFEALQSSCIQDNLATHICRNPKWRGAWERKRANTRLTRGRM